MMAAALVRTGVHVDQTHATHTDWRHSFVIAKSGYVDSGSVSCGNEHLTGLRFDLDAVDGDVDFIWC